MTVSLKSVVPVTPFSKSDIIIMESIDVMSWTFDARRKFNKGQFTAWQKLSEMQIKEYSIIEPLLSFFSPLTICSPEILCNLVFINRPSYPWKLLPAQAEKFSNKEFL